MATFWWGIAFAFALALAGMAVLDAGQSWLAIAALCAVGGGLALRRHTHAKDAKLDELLATMRQLLPKAQEAVQARPDPIGRRLVAAAGEIAIGHGSANVSLQLSGRGTVRTVAVLADAVLVVEKLANNEPVTAEEENRAVAGLEELTLAERGEVEERIVNEDAS